MPQKLKSVALIFKRYFIFYVTRHMAFDTIIEKFRIFCH